MKIFKGAPFIAYVDRNSSKKFIERCLKKNLTGTVFIYDSIWTLMQQLELARGRSYINSYLTKQTLLDPEKNRHSPELYAVWNLKTYLLYKSTLWNPYKSEFFLYTDSGAWRRKIFPNWPDQEFVTELAKKLDNRFLYGQVGWPQKFKRNKNANIIQGTFFAGSSKAVENIYDQYFRLHDEWLDKGLFIGKEQNLMNEVALSRATSLVARLKTHNLDCNNKTYSIWFFYQFYFAHSNYFICNGEKLNYLIFDKARKSVPN